MAKPRTKLEKRVFELSEKLPALTDKHIEYGNENAFWKYYDTSHKSICCLECGHKWKAPLTNYSHTCPECKLKLRGIHQHKNWMRAQGYLMVIDRIEEFQVLRYLYINKWMKKGQSPRYDHQEVSQVFIHPKGKVTIMGADKNHFNAYYSPQWKWGSDLSIKPHRNQFYQNRYTEHYSCLYPNKKVIPELKRNGFKHSFYGCNPTEMMHSLLTYPVLETLLKRGSKDIFKEGVKYISKIENYWDELKITFRNNYVIKDYSIWTDYIDLLRYFEKDTTNSMFVCPENLNKAHDKWMNKKRRVIEHENRIRREKEAEERRKKEEYWRKHYPKIRKAFLDFSIKYEHITIELIKSVEQLKEESELLKHCAYANGYYDKEKSLLLSARVNGKVVETIEINLERMSIVQARGLKNAATKYNTKIVKLVEENLPKIHKLYKKQLKLSA